MAFVQVDYTSEVLNLRSSMNVILPQKREEGEKYPVLWLLHGFSDSHSAWARFTALERYIDEIYPNLCVIMPAADHSFYTDMAKYRKYYTHLTEELPQIVSDMFPVSTKREDNFIAGLSMGGYGSFKIAMNQPERFAAAVSFSGVLKMDHRMEDEPEVESVGDTLYHVVFGDLSKFKGSKHDVCHMTKQAFDKGVAPKIYFCCGEDDFLYENNLVYKAFLDELGMDYRWDSDPGYKHSWKYWDLKIQEALRFFKEGV